MWIGDKPSVKSVLYVVLRITKVSTPLAEVEETSSLRVA
jgi:hypothetical protein